MLSLNAQHLPARHEDREAWAGGQQVGHAGRGGDHLLEVVEDQQEVAIAQDGPQAFGERSVARVRQIQRPRDFRQDEVGIAHQGQGNEDRPIRKVRSESAATWSARRVLPTPPGPVNVTRRTSFRRSRSWMAVISRSRPTSGVSGMGRVLTGGRNGALFTV